MVDSVRTSEKLRITLGVDVCAGGDRHAAQTAMDARTRRAGVIDYFILRSTLRYLGVAGDRHWWLAGLAMYGN